MWVPYFSPILREVRNDKVEAQRGLSRVANPPEEELQLPRVPTHALSQVHAPSYTVPI